MYSLNIENADQKSEHGCFYRFMFGAYAEEYAFLDRRILCKSFLLPTWCLWIWRIITAVGCIGICTFEWIFSIQDDYQRHFSYLTIWTMFLTWYCYVTFFELC